MKIKLTDDQCKELLHEGVLELADETLSVFEEGDWEQEGKNQYRNDVYLSTTGAYYNDWWNK